MITRGFNKITSRGIDLYYWYIKYLETQNASGLGTICSVLLTPWEVINKHYWCNKNNRKEAIFNCVRPIENKVPLIILIHEDSTFVLVWRFKIKLESPLCVGIIKKTMFRHYELKTTFLLNDLFYIFLLLLISNKKYWYYELGLPCWYSGW